MKPILARRPLVPKTSSLFPGFGVAGVDVQIGHEYHPSAEACMFDMNGLPYDPGTHAGTAAQHPGMHPTAEGGRVVPLSPVERKGIERARLNNGEHNAAPNGSVKVWAPRATKQIELAPKAEVGLQHKAAIRGSQAQVARTLATIKAGEEATGRAEKRLQERLHCLPEALYEGETIRAELALLLSGLLHAKGSSEIVKVFKAAIGATNYDWLNAQRPTGEELVCTTNNPTGYVRPSIHEKAGPPWAMELAPIVGGQPQSMIRARAGAQLAGDDLLKRWKATLGLALSNLPSATVGGRRDSIPAAELESAALSKDYLGKLSKGQQSRAQVARNEQRGGYGLRKTGRGAQRGRLQPRRGQRPNPQHQNDGWGQFYQQHPRSYQPHQPRWQPHQHQQQGRGRGGRGAGSRGAKGRGAGRQ